MLVGRAVLDRKSYFVKSVIEADRSIFGKTVAIQFHLQPHRQRIEVDTYHWFFWRILKAHGYLVGLPRTLTILTPQGVSIALSEIRADYGRKMSDGEKAERRTRETAEKARLAKDDGRVCFDLFADYAGDILQGSARVRQLIATKYPVIILDEFQDTNAGQWRVVKELGRHVELHALADPEQRIYDWIGADPERLNHFIETFTPTVKDLSDDNHRSAGTEIAMFGNDILKGIFRKTTYVGVECTTYEPYEAWRTRLSLRRSIEPGSAWSQAANKTGPSPSLCLQRS